MRLHPTCYTLLLFVVSSCVSAQKTIKFPKRPNEAFTNNHLRDYFRTNPSPNIVLRISAGAEKGPGNNRDNNQLYNTIEKELLKQGFTVRDRGSLNTTNTDLVLEIVNMDQSVIYSTSQVTHTGKKGERQEPGSIEYKRYGATIEFRLIITATNEFAGTYTYNYQPCLDGCALSSFTVTGKSDNKKVQLRDPISLNTMQEFIKFGVQDMVRSLKAGK